MRIQFDTDNDGMPQKKRVDLFKYRQIQAAQFIAHFFLACDIVTFSAPSNG